MDAGSACSTLACMGFALIVDAVSVMRPHGLYALTTMYNICGGTMLEIGLQLCAKHRQICMTRNHGLMHQLLGPP